MSAQILVKTQRDRANGFTRYVNDLVMLPFIVGYHWFQFYDDSPGGRSFDGQDSNFSILDIDGRPYEVLTEAMRKTNAAASCLHAKSPPVTDKAALIDNPPAVRRSLSRATGPAVFSEHFRAGGYPDLANGGRVTLSNSGGGLTAACDTGTGWGMVISISPDMEDADQTGYADISAYQGMEMGFTAPAGFRFFIFVKEQGVEAPGKSF